MFCGSHCGHVDRCCGFIHDEDAALPHEGSGETEELPLALTEVLSSLRHCGVCGGSTKPI